MQALVEDVVMRDARYEMRGVNKRFAFLASRISHLSYLASWKMIPSVKRDPEWSRLTPCRIVTR